MPRGSCDRNQPRTTCFPRRNSLAPAATAYPRARCKCPGSRSVPGRAVVQRSGNEIRSVDMLELMSRLVDKSLVIADISPDNMRVRYRMLETIRQFAAAHLISDATMEAIRR